MAALPANYSQNPPMASNTSEWSWAWVKSKLGVFCGIWRTGICAAKPSAGERDPLLPSRRIKEILPRAIESGRPQVMIYGYQSAAGLGQAPPTREDRPAPNTCDNINTPIQGNDDSETDSFETDSFETDSITSDDNRGLEWEKVVQTLSGTDWEAMDLDPSDEYGNDIARGFGLTHKKDTQYIWHHGTDSIICLCEEGVFSFGLEFESGRLISTDISRALHYMKTPGVKPEGLRRNRGRTYEPGI